LVVIHRQGTSWSKYIENELIKMGYELVIIHRERVDKNGVRVDLFPYIH